MANRVKYLEVYYRLRGDIMSGKYPENAFLPPEMELCKLYGVGRSTLRRAISLLSEENLVSAKQGVGTRVVSNDPDDATIFKLKDRYYFYPHFLVEGEIRLSQSPISIDSVLATKKIAQRLGLEVGTSVYRVQRLRYVNGLCYAYIISYINPNIAPDLDKHVIEDHITEFLVRQYGLKRTNTFETLEIVPVSFVEAQLLNVEPGRPLFGHMRTGYVGEQVFDYTEQLYQPDLVQIRVPYIPDARRDAMEPDEDAETGFGENSAAP